MDLLLRRLLWIDGSAGLLVGVAVLLLRERLVAWYGLPRGLLTAAGLANLLYGVYSLSLASRAVRPVGLIGLLVAANAAWAVVCVVLVVLYGRQATLLGLGHLIGEGLFVSGLAALEWRWRERLRVASCR